MDETLVDVRAAPHPRKVPAGRAMSWLGSGFGLFKRAPWIWVLITLIFLVGGTLLGLVPGGSLLYSLISAVITGGLMLGCRSLDEGEPLEVAHLFAGFSHRTGKLVAAGALYLAMMAGVAILTGIIASLTGLQLSDLEQAGQGTVSRELMLAVLIFSALVVPVAMCFYFSPALLVFHETLGVLDAFRLSFSGCLRNVLPFLVFGLVALVLGILALIPFMLGILVLVPVMLGATYYAYKDIFLDTEENPL